MTAGQTLDEPAAKRLLAQYGVAVPRSVVLTPGTEVDAALFGLAPPLAMKLIATGVLHKSDVGGVALGLSTAQEAASAIATMTEAAKRHGHPIDGFLLEEMAAKGHELVIGGLIDPIFGPVIMTGLGGVFVEVFADVAFRVCPITGLDAEAMLDELRAAPILAGARGGIVADRKAIVEALLRIGGEDGLLMSCADTLVELDVNPLIVSATGATAVDARVILLGSAEPLASAHPDASSAEGGPFTRVADERPDRRPADPIESFRPLFVPRSVAVAGASTKGSGPGNNFLRQLQDYGFAGAIYPIHPSAESVAGLPAYRTLADTPQPIDYAYIATAAEHAPALLSGANGRVKFAQVMSGGFGEASGGGALRQADLLDAARAGGMRLLGPNCLGTHSPRGKITFVDQAPADVGSVGVLSQSGGLAIDMLRRGQVRGVRFSALVTLGNSADLGPCDLLEYLLADEQTRVIGLYLEDVAEGRRFFSLLRDAGARKPVVLLKGGRTAPGQRASASHTGALAGDMRIWAGLARQTGMVLVDTLDEFLDTLLGFQTLAPHAAHPTHEVVLFGNGGGTSVLATDCFAARGFDISPFDEPTLNALRALDLPPGSSIVNPIDTPASALRREDGRIARRILEAVRHYAKPDAVVMHINLPVVLSYRNIDLLGNLMDAALSIRGAEPGAPHFVLVLRSDGEADIEQRKNGYRTQAVASGIPVFNELVDAAKMLAGMREHERFLRAATPVHAALRGSDVRE
ncbi:MAG: acetate--CoA ligase family protein [Variovorax sp.]